MKMRDIVIGQIRHEQTERIPYTLYFDQEVEESLDVYYKSPAWRNRLVPYISRIQGLDIMQWKKVDDQYSEDAFGGLWRIDRRPWHLETPPLQSPSLEGYIFPDVRSFLDEERKERLKSLWEGNKDTFLIIGMGWGIWEKYWQLRGFENALADCVEEEEFFEEVLDIITEFYISAIDFYKDFPADAIMFGEDWGDQRGVILGPERWRRYIKPRWEKIYRHVHAQGKYVINHCCGSVEDIMPDIIEIGLDVLESVQPEAKGMNPYILKQKWGNGITFWGGLGTQQLLPFGTPEDIRHEVRKLCSIMGEGGGYILAPAKPVMREVPLENAVAILEEFTKI